MPLRQLQNSAGSCLQGRNCRKLNRTLGAPRRAILKSCFVLALFGCVFGCVLRSSTAFLAHSSSTKVTLQLQGLMPVSSKQRTSLAAMPSAAVEDKVESDENFRVLTMTLLQRVGNAENIIAAGELEVQPMGTLISMSFFFSCKKLNLSVIKRTQKSFST